MAKLMVSTDDDGGRTETWEVGRLKFVKDLSVALPQGGFTPSAFIFVWQALDAAARASGSVISDLRLDITGCGTASEWVMVEPKPVIRTSTRGRSRGRGQGVRGRSQGRGRAR